MGTQWMPMTRMEPKSWLLGTGEVVTEPALEMTGTGRKIRVAGTANSVYHYDVDQMLWESVRALAKQKQTHVHFETTRPVLDLLESAAGFKTAEVKAKVHLVHDAANDHGETKVWWRFKDAKTPFEVLLTVALGTIKQGSAWHQRLTAVLTMPTRTYARANWNDTIAVNVSTERFQDLTRAIGNATYCTLWDEYLRDHPVEWPADLTSGEQYATARQGVAALLKTVRQFDALQEIEVPDLGDPENPSYRTLELYDTNFNEALVSDLTEYLEGAPTIEQAAELYQQLLDTFRSCGIVVDNRTQNDFQAALLAGDRSSLGVQVFNLAEAGHQLDSDHKLSIHLPTGAFIVECSHREVDRSAVAEKWEEALTMASLTGKESELLAFARGYAKEHSKTRTKRILRERKANTA